MPLQRRCADTRAGCFGMQCSQELNGVVLNNHKKKDPFIVLKIGDPVSWAVEGSAGGCGGLVNPAPLAQQHCGAGLAVVVRGHVSRETLIRCY